MMKRGTSRYLPGGMSISVALHLTGYNAVIQHQIASHFLFQKMKGGGEVRGQKFAQNIRRIHVTARHGGLRESCLACVEVLALKQEMNEVPFKESSGMAGTLSAASAITAQSVNHREGYTLDRVHIVCTWFARQIC